MPGAVLRALVVPAAVLALSGAAVEALRHGPPAEARRPDIGPALVAYKMAEPVPEIEDPIVEAPPSDAPEAGPGRNRARPYPNASGWG